jgi:hypothetical protein
MRFCADILLRNGDFLHDDNISLHEDLIDLYNIRDNTIEPNFVRLEYSPKTVNDFADISKYELTVDGFSPDWFEYYRESVTARFQNIVEKRIITTDRNILFGGIYIIKDCHIKRVKHATIIYLQGSIQSIWEGTTVWDVNKGATIGEIRCGGVVNEISEGGLVEEVRFGGIVKKVKNGGTINELRNGGIVYKVLEGGIIKEIKEGGNLIK